MGRIEDELVMPGAEPRSMALLNLLFSANKLRQDDVARLAPYGISPQQYNILRILRGARPERMQMNAVKQRMLDRAPNATRLADKLIAKGLVVRERSSSDRRVIHMSIGQAGLDLLEQIETRTGSVLENWAHRLSEEEAKDLNALLDKLRG